MVSVIYQNQCCSMWENVTFQTLKLVHYPVTKKITEKRLKWYGHVKRSDDGHALRRMLKAPVQGKRQERKAEHKWKDSCKRNMEIVELKEEDALSRTN